MAEPMRESQAETDEAYKLAHQPEPLRKPVAVRLISEITLDCGHKFRAWVTDEPAAIQADGTFAGFPVSLSSSDETRFETARLKDPIGCRQCLAASICTCSSGMKSMHVHSGDCPVMYMDREEGTD